ncbi:hypothetical protein FB567DRAFT_550868 [Paraphoma chrysanthemicola]|uniref:Uncharacterized protein n=1 Tax=Paraphoma chrysanthemicola TaxID=798071 RepID=A0A8K0R123_9PLEO|nr:hypothetical protein FB567DRAFT_550868 [Paraphoma chrysanthemicola]
MVRHESLDRKDQSLQNSEDAVPAIQVQFRFEDLLSLFVRSRMRLLTTQLITSLHNFATDMESSTEMHWPIGVTLQQLCDLPTTIHPILARENWIHSNTRKSEALWDDIQPVLRFVTQMIMDEIALLSWTHLFAGEQRTDKKTMRTYLDETSRSWDHAALPILKKYLSQKIAGQIKFTFSTTGECCYGITCSNWRDIVDVLEPSISREEKMDIFCKNSTDELVVVAFRNDFKDYFISGRRSLQQDVFTSFFFAVTIVHELAHAVHALHENAIYRRNVSLRESCSESINEPCFSREEARHPKYLHPRNELGWSLETYLFGLCFASTMTPEYGAVDVCHSSTDIARTETNNYLPTSQLSVVKFFQQKKWNALRKMPKVDLKGWPRARLYIEHRHRSQHECLHVLVPNAALSEESDGMFNRTLAPLLSSCYIHKASLILRSLFNFRKSKASQQHIV